MIAIAAIALLLQLVTPPVDDPAVDAPRVAGTLSFTCAPDPKAKAAGATPFDDVLELEYDRVRSKALTAEGFPIALCIPKVAAGVTTINATFKKKDGGGATATYALRARDGGKVVTGSLTRTSAGKTLRYTIGLAGAKPASSTTRPAKADPALDPEVLRVAGGLARLMCVRTAMADAGVDVDKAKLGAILESAGADANELRLRLAKGELTPAAYGKIARSRTEAAQAEVARLVGAARWAKVESAYAAPFASAYVHLNQLRAAAAVATSGPDEPPPGLDPDDALGKADRAVRAALLDLAKLARKREDLTAASTGMIQQRAHGEVVAALGERRRERFETALEGMTSYRATPTTAPATRPAKAGKQ